MGECASHRALGRAGTTGQLVELSVILHLTVAVWDAVRFKVLMYRMI